ncbi:MAG: zf-HC2 domain-containing protein [Treponema sp.]|jgi:hypothetical protein|nr:zf-HC2 domain-containing protein [Treponema sp.]
MCPDRQILSVYFDGELESPWREKLERHLEGCPECRDRIEAYRTVRRRFFPSITEGVTTDSGERVWEKMTIAIRPGRVRSKFWSGSISVPLPVAAAAGLIMVLAMAALITLRQPVRPAPDPQLAGVEMQDMTPVSDMATLLQYLGSESSPDMVIIRLPDKTFTNAGEPQMLRAADYSRGAGSR